MSVTKSFYYALSVLAISFIASAAKAECEVDISNYVDWQIIYSGTVTGYIDENGQEVDEFEGCEYDRVLIIDYSRTVTCTEYNYRYAYRPDIVIMSNGHSLEACIDNEMFDVRR